MHNSFNSIFEARKGRKSRATDAVIWSRNLLLTFRIMSISVLMMVLLHSSFVLTPLQYYRHLTEWGLTITLVTFMVLVMNSFSKSNNFHVMRKNTNKSVASVMNAVTGGKSRMQSEYENTIMDRVCVICFETAFTSELLITLIFWVVLTPGGITRRIQKGSKLHQELPDLTSSVLVYWTEVHSFPMLLLLIDLIFNKILFSKTHVLFPLLYCCAFLFSEVLFTSYTGVPAYFIATWDNFESYFFAIISGVILFFAFYIGLWIGRIKNHPNFNYHTERIMGKIVERTPRSYK